MRAIIYARVSQDKRNGRSVEEQVDEGTAWCQREGWPIVRTIVDNDRGATRHAKRKREGWDDVRRAIAGREGDVLVTWAASRAQRDMDVYVELRRLCADNGVRWGYDGTVYDLTNRQDRFRTGLDALVAEDEAERNREAVLRAMRANAAKCLPHGRLPYGYRRDYRLLANGQREFVRQVQHSEQAAIVREAARRFLAGESTRSIARDFDARNVPTPHASAKGWNLSTLRRILTNPAMNGWRVHKGERVGRGDWDPILDDEAFQRIETRFADPSRTTTRQRDAVRLLTGVARCGVCAGPMTYAKQGGFGGRKVRLTYTCRHRFCTARDMVALDHYVTGVVLDHLRATNAVDLLDDDGLDPAAREAAQQVREWTAMIDDATAQFLAKNITAATLGRIETELRAQIANAQRRVRYSTLPSIAVELAESDDIRAEWDAYSVEQRRDLIRAMFEIVVLPTGSGRRTFDPDCVVIEPRR